MNKLFLVSISSILILSSCFSKNDDTSISTEGGVKHTTITNTSTQTSSTDETGSWNPDTTRTQQPINVGSGTPIIISTNGPDVRAMTPEEQKSFQEEIKGK